MVGYNCCFDIDFPFALNHLNNHFSSIMKLLRLGKNSCSFTDLIKQAINKTIKVRTVNMQHINKNSLYRIKTI